MGFIHRGDDIIYGFNFDIPDGMWDYKVYKERGAFYVGIKAGGRLYRVHGVTASGNFANLPYMNAPECGEYRRGKEFCRLDLLVDGYLRQKIDYDGVLETVKRRSVVNSPGCSMHSLFGDARGNMLLVEPGLGYREIKDKYALVCNFPIMQDKDSLHPELECWYGFDRYERAKEILDSSGGSFTLEDGMRVLGAAWQTEGAPTRVSFVYSVGTKTVVYKTDGGDAGTLALKEVKQ